MKKSTEDLVREIDELKSELRQMKEIVGMLFNMVVDSEGDDEEDFLGFPELGSSENPRFNT
ncbi:MAG TPA: hypothetical protein VMW26_09130 [Methanomassiliicoccales archaeon]|nr:hypothetical protein [Methanomassiliicoccales archaeon]